MAHVRLVFSFFPQVRQSPAGPVQAALDCRYGQVEGLGDLHFRAVLPVAHDDRGAVCTRSAESCATDGCSAVHQLSDYQQLNRLKICHDILYI